MTETLEWPDQTSRDSQSAADKYNDRAPEVQAEREEKLRRINARIAEVKNSSLIQKLTSGPHSLTEELNRLYRERRELGGEAPETKPLVEADIERPAERSLRELWMAVKNSQLEPPARIKAFFQFARNIAPQILRPLEVRRDEFPVDPKKYHLERRMEEGGESEVYELVSLDAEYPTLVLKIYDPEENEEDEKQERAATDPAQRTVIRKENERKRAAALLARAQKVRQEYEHVRQWYQELPNIIPEEFYYVGKVPSDDRSALFTIQDYFGERSDMVDIGAASEKRLSSILRKHPLLKKSFIKFVDRTWEKATNENLAIDFFGAHNVNIIQTEKGPQLIVLDAHSLMPFTTGEENREIISRLKRVADGLREAEEKPFKQAA